MFSVNSVYILFKAYNILICVEIVLFRLLGLMDWILNGTWLMSGDNLLSHLPVKFYSDEMTETKKIIYLERKFQKQMNLLKIFLKWHSAGFIFIKNITLPV